MTRMLTGYALWYNRKHRSHGHVFQNRFKSILCQEDTYLDSANKFLNRVRIVPLTSKTDRLYPSEALVVFEGKESKAMADQLATVCKSRLFKRAGVLSAKDMQRVEAAVKKQLGIS